MFRPLVVSTLPKEPETSGRSCEGGRNLCARPQYQFSEQYLSSPARLTDEIDEGHRRIELAGTMRVDKNGLQRRSGRVTVVAATPWTPKPLSPLLPEDIQDFRFARPVNRRTSRR